MIVVLIVKVFVWLIRHIVPTAILIVKHVLSSFWVRVSKLYLGSKSIMGLVWRHKPLILHVVLLIHVNLVKLVSIEISFRICWVVTTGYCRVRFNIFVARCKWIVVLLMKILVLLSHLVKGCWSLVLIALEFLHLVVTYSVGRQLLLVSHLGLHVLVLQSVQLGLVKQNLPRKNFIADQNTQLFTLF